MMPKEPQDNVTAQAEVPIPQDNVTAQAEAPIPPAENLAGEPEARQPVQVDKEELDRIVRHHVWAAMGVGLVPIPLVDLVAVSAVQVDLVVKLATLYQVDFSHERVRGLVVALAGSVLPVSLAEPFASLVKFIPIIGQSVGAIAMPVVSGAATYAVAWVFIRHFESGGDFLCFDMEKAKETYTDLFNKGKAFVADLRTNPPQEPPAPESTQPQA